VVQITAVPDVAKMVGVNRILQGQTVPNPVGNSGMTPQQEKELRHKYVLRAMELFQMEVEGPTVFLLEGMA
jgi:glycine/betaine/sarcosine/D-proline reductase family selenoprotein B